MQPARAPIERDTERGHVGVAPAADASRGLDHHNLAARRLDATRRRNPGDSRADDDYVSILWQRRSEHRRPCERERGSAGQKVTPRDRHMWIFRNVVAVPLPDITNKT